MRYQDVFIIVVGSLNTDIVALEVNELLGSGELTRSGRLHIGPGGKSRNIAQMIASLMGRGRVAMVGRTSRDPFSLWEIPVKALANAGVITDFIKILDYAETDQFPGVALIAVNKSGENQIYCIPGIGNSFCPDDIDNASALFEEVDRKNGILALTFEQPFATALYAVKKACSKGVRVILDPGGIDREEDYRELLSQGLFFIKPNEHEARILTGMEVNDLDSAHSAADVLFSLGIENVLITHGSRGAYFFKKNVVMHIAVPRLDENYRDETGCGDQVTAVLCSEIAEGTDVILAAQRAILAGTMQYHRLGILPVTREELNIYTGKMEHE